MNPDQIREAIAYLDACLRDLHQSEDGELRSLSDDEQTRFDEGFALRAKYVADLERHNRIADLADVPAKREESKPGGFNINKGIDAYRVAADGRATGAQLRDAAVQALEGRLADEPDEMAAVTALLRRHVTNDSSMETREWARNLVLRTSDDYVSGFSKMITGREHMLSPEERTALSSGSNTNGGFLLPTHLDPTIILTNNGVSNVIRDISRVVTLTEGSVWNGVTSAGVTASFDAELAEVSDDSPTFARVSIPVFTARAFVQASIEAFQDINGLAADVRMLFADAKDNLEESKYTVGSGSGEPTGIFTALDANTNVEVISTTAATIGEVDLHGLYRQVPVRWRKNGSWLMNPLYSLAIKRLGTAVSSVYSGDLREAPADHILGKTAVDSDSAPTTQTTTVNDNEVVFGDFRNFVIVDKPGGMSVEYIPHLFNTSNNLPDGRRGFFAWWRTGSDSVNDLGFRLLQDKTSA